MTKKSATTQGSTKKSTASKTTKKSAAKTTTKAAAKSTAKTTAKKSTAKTTAKSKATTKKKPASTSTSTVKPSSNGHVHHDASGNGSVGAEQEFDFSRQLSDEELRKVKTGLTRKELEEFRAILLEKRAEIFGDVQGMQEARNNANGGEISHMPLHMADVGSDNYEQEFTLGLMESERRILIEIDEALGRIKNGTYGVCIHSGKPIPRERLVIKPWAKYTIEVVRERERRGLL